MESSLAGASGFHLVATNGVIGHCTLKYPTIRNPFRCRSLPAVSDIRAQKSSMR